MLTGKWPNATQNDVHERRATFIIDLSQSTVDNMKRLSIVVAALLFIVAGCGQSGPLYISGNPSKIQEPPPAAESTADEEQKEDGEADADADKE